MLMSQHRCLSIRQHPQTNQISLDFTNAFLGSRTWAGHHTMFGHHVNLGFHLAVAISQTLLVFDNLVSLGEGFWETKNLGRFLYQAPLLESV